MIKPVDLKYLIAYIIPITAFFAILNLGWFSFLTVIFAFGIIPIFDMVFNPSQINLSDTEKEQKRKSIFFDWLLMLNLPIVFFLIFMLQTTVRDNVLSTFELIGLLFSIGIVLSTAGINVAHELGHRQGKIEQLLSKILLLPSLYMHFFIEHNRGHHKHVATPIDPATATVNQSLFSFWYQSVVKGYISAWNMETKRLKIINKSPYSFDNQMIVFTVVQVAYLVLTFAFFGFIGLLIALVLAIKSLLLLECINYIEHYGLQRKKDEKGNYERVKSKHSWNSDHIIGRIMLYELTRHSDHHFRTSKKFQILDHHDNSPQLPFGYPMSILISFIPSLWFSIMNKELKKFQEISG